MKRLCTILAALTLAALCLVLIPREAQAATSGYYTYTVSNGEATITDCETTIRGVVTIPSTLGGCPVTSIGTRAFYGCYALTSVTIPDSVTSIETCAFEYCTGLTSVTIGNKVVSINDNAFYNCSRLTGVTIPAGVVSIGNGVFDECTNLTGIWVNEDNAHYASDEYGILFNKDMSEILVMPRGFSGRYSIPSGVTNIAKDAFYYCVGLTGVTIPDGVTSIGLDAFRNCTSLTSISIPNSVTSIVERAFYGCSSLSDVTYCGTEEQWNQISIGSNNAKLTNATRSYHNWIDTTCTAHKTCSICGETEGSVLGHSWAAATCVTPKTCEICATTEGSVLGHAWVNATCLRPKTCSTCGITEGETLGHVYDSNRDFNCNTCGYNRLAADSDLKFYGSAGLSFQDYIGMQILVKNTTFSDYEKVYVIAVQTTPDGDVETTLSGETYATNYTLFEQQIVSWSMTEPVTMTLYAEKNGIIYQGASITASVKELAMDKLAIYSSASNTRACTALVDMLNYGAAVQVAYDHNTSNLPNADLGEFAEFGTTEDPVFDATNEITGSGSVKVYLHNISLQAKVEFQLMVKTSALEGCNVKATLNGEEVGIEYTPHNNYTIIKVASSAANMRDTYTIGIYDADGNAVMQIYNVSVEAYSKEQLDSNRGTVLIAMMKYGDSVAAL